MTMKNDASYKEYLDSIDNKKRKQLMDMSQDYSKSNAKRRESAVQFIKRIVGRNKQIENSKESYIGEMDGR